MNLTTLKRLKSECRICIGSKMCPIHKKMWDEWVKE